MGRAPTLQTATSAAFFIGRPTRTRRRESRRFPAEEEENWIKANDLGAAIRATVRLKL
jgi:hypothetical protein